MEETSKKATRKNNFKKGLAGIEPTTQGSAILCSTGELKPHRHFLHLGVLKNKIIITYKKLVFPSTQDI